jgi:hypothetical protein
MPALDPTPVLTGETFPGRDDRVPAGSRVALVGCGTAALEPSTLRALRSLRPLNSLGSLLSQRWAGSGCTLTALISLTAQERPARFFRFLAVRCRARRFKNLGFSRVRPFFSFLSFFSRVPGVPGLGGEDGTQSAIAKGPCARNGAALSERTSGPESGGRAVPSIAVLCHSLPFGANSPQVGNGFPIPLSGAGFSDLSERADPTGAAR